MQRKIFVSKDRFEASHISTFIIDVTNECNLRCKYCCFSGNYPGMRTHSASFMDGATLEAALEFILNHADPEEALNVSFFGGEALLRLETIVRAIEYLQLKFGDRVTFDISTNGTTLDAATITRICGLRNVNISVSLDGCREIHDRNRINAAGKGSYDTVIENLRIFRNSYPEEYDKRVRLLITAESLEDIRTMNLNFRELKKFIGHRPLFISHVYTNFSQGKLYQESAEEKKAFLEEAYARKTAGTEDLYTIVLDDLLKKTRRNFAVGDNKLIPLHTCLDDMYSIHIDVDGKLFPCEKFAAEPSIGNVFDGLDHQAMSRMSIEYAFRRTLICGQCEEIEYCTRCLADTKMKINEQRQMCSSYRDNIRLAHHFQQLIQNNA